MLKSLGIYSTATIVLFAGLPLGANAALVGNAQLLIGEGSFWEIDNGSEMVPATMVGHDHLRLGTAQSASIDHWGHPDGTESPGIDAPANFFLHSALHQTTSPVTVLSASGNTATLDFSGWEWIWALYSHGTATGAWDGNPDGVAQVVCAVDCGHGDSYVLSYSGALEAGTGSGLAGERYRLHIEGTVSAVPLPAAAWLLLSGLGAVAAVGRRRGGE